jgi:hypothetical protein
VTGRRKVAAAIGALVWFVVVGVAWLISLGGQIAPCLGLPGTAANKACVSAWEFTHPRPPWLESPLFWIGLLAIGFGVVWIVARPARR